MDHRSFSCSVRNSSGAHRALGGSSHSSATVSSLLRLSSKLGFIHSF